MVTCTIIKFLYLYFVLWIRHAYTQFSGDIKPLFPNQMLVSESLANNLACDSHPSNVTGWTIDSPGLDVILPAHYSRKAFDPTQIDFLKTLYSKLYNVSVSNLVLSSIFKKYSSVTLNSVQFGTYRIQASFFSIAIVVWDAALFWFVVYNGEYISFHMSIYSFYENVSAINEENKFIC